MGPARHGSAGSFDQPTMGAAGSGWDHVELDRGLLCDAHPHRAQRSPVCDLLAASFSVLRLRVAVLLLSKTCAQDDRGCGRDGGCGSDAGFGLVLSSALCCRVCRGSKENPGTEQIGGCLV